MLFDLAYFSNKLHRNTKPHRFYNFHYIVANYQRFSLACIYRKTRIFTETNFSSVECRRFFFFLRYGISSCRSFHKLCNQMSVNEFDIYSILKRITWKPRNKYEVNWIRTNIRCIFHHQIAEKKNQPLLQSDISNAAKRISPSNIGIDRMPKRVKLSNKISDTCTKIPLNDIKWIYDWKFQIYSLFYTNASFSIWGQGDGVVLDYKIT